MGLTFDKNLLASDGQDLQMLLPGFGKPSAFYQKALFEHKISHFAIQTSLWLAPCMIKVKKQPLEFKELYSIINKELNKKLTAKERKDIAAFHQKAFNQEAPSDMYITRKDAFSPNGYPNWFFSTKKGMLLLEAGT